MAGVLFRRIIASRARLYSQIEYGFPAERLTWAIIQLLGPPVTPIVTRSSVYCGCKRRPVGFVA